MAAIRKRGTRYHVQIRKIGHPTLTQSFLKLADAKAWARKIESEMERGTFIDDLQARETTLAQLLNRYEKEILPEKRSFYAVKSQIKIINRLIGKYTLKEVTTHILTENLVKKRPVAGQTVRKDLSLIQRVLNTAINESPPIS
jgi:hypothetical protein